MTSMTLVHSPFVIDAVETVCMFEHRVRMNLAHIVGDQADLGRAAVLVPEGVGRQTVVQRADAPDASFQPPVRRIGPLPKSNDRKPGEVGAGVEGWPAGAAAP